MPSSNELQPERGHEVVDFEERRWLPRHLAGDAKAFSELVSAYRRPVYGYLVRCGVDPATRDDLFQEALLKVHAAAKNYQPSRPLKPWLFTIVANTVRNHFRRKRVAELALEDATAASLESRTPSAPRVFEAQAKVEVLEAAIRELPIAQREVLLLTCVEAMDQNAVSQALGVPVNTVKTHLRRARLRLAKVLAADGEAS